MNWVKDLWRVAKSDFRTENLAPEIREAASISIPSNILPSSRWSRGLKENSGIFPHLRTSTLSSSDFPLGTSSSGRFGSSKRKSFCSFNISSSSEDLSLISLVRAKASFSSLELFFLLAFRCPIFLDKLFSKAFLSSV